MHKKLLMLLLHPLLLDGQLRKKLPPSLRPGFRAIGPSPSPGSASWLPCGGSPCTGCRSCAESAPSGPSSHGTSFRRTAPCLPQPRPVQEEVLRWTGRRRKQKLLIGLMRPPSLLPSPPASSLKPSSPPRSPRARRHRPAGRRPQGRPPFLLPIHPLRPRRERHVVSARSRLPEPCPAL